MKITVYLNHDTNEILGYEDAFVKEREQTKTDYTFEDFLLEQYNAEDLFRFFSGYECVEDAIADLKRDYEETIDNMTRDELDHGCVWSVHEVEV